MEPKIKAKESASFDIIQEKFSPVEGQKVGIAVYNAMGATPDYASVPHVQQQEVDKIFGRVHDITIYAAKYCLLATVTFMTISTHLEDVLVQLFSSCACCGVEYYLARCK
jgi:hypothetical protein